MLSLGLVLSSVFLSSVSIMPLAKCLFSWDGKTCTYEFAGDGHTLCVPHHPYVSGDFTYDPYASLKKSRDAVKQSAKRKGADSLAQHVAEGVCVGTWSRNQVRPAGGSLGAGSCGLAGATGGRLLGPPTP